MRLLLLLLLLLLFRRVKMTKDQPLTLSKFLTCFFYAAGRPVMIGKKRNLQYGGGYEEIMPLVIA
jgi:hypothetical protein